MNCNIAMPPVASRQLLSALSRRGFLASALLSGLALGWRGAQAGLRDPEFREISLSNPNTGETCQAVYYVRGVLSEGGLEQVDHLMRDWRSGAVAQVDVDLIDRLWWLQQMSAPGEPVEVTSGYRTRATNDKLMTEGAARNSLHLRARAADIRVPGVPTERLADLAYSIARHNKRGGVGFYPDRRFVHIDTGAFRRWER